jgi:Fe-Mn family superoxide dismutase
MNRRHALRTLALSAGALAAGQVDRALAAHDTKAGSPTPAAATPATAPAPAGPFTLPPLPYPYEALEPHVDAETMRIHHDKHHAAYVTNLNKAVAGHAALADRSVEDLLRRLDALPEAIRTAVRNHGGGHANHTLFWNSLKAGGAVAPSGALADAIAKTFGSHAAFVEQWKTAAAAVFGSGWAWLSLDRARGLVIEGLPNQDSPLLHGRAPVVGIDVWEHAYYLKYQNRRPDYLAAIVQVIDWDAVSERYRRLTAG